MTWGNDTDATSAREQLELFVDKGGTLVDTAASYVGGDSEKLLGQLLAKHISRREVVLVSKAGVRSWRTGERSAVSDAGRGTLLDTLDDSLARLGTDHLDLWLVQIPDYYTPMEETASALEMAVRSGRTRYVGVSNYPAWAAVHMADLLGSAIGMAGVQTEYSLLNRSAEQELIPAAQELGFGIMGWSALGRGVLTGKYRNATPPDSRGASVHLAGFVAPYLNDDAARVVNAVATAAAGLERSPLEVALAWARGSDGIDCSIVGARNTHQLRDILATADLQLEPQIRHVLNEVS